MTFVERCAQRSLTHLITGLLCYLTRDPDGWDAHKAAADRWAYAALHAAALQAQYNLPDSWFEQVERDAIASYSGETN